MVVSTFFLSDKDDQKRFFKKNFLLADIKPDTVLGMPLVTMSKADIDFSARNLQWKCYTTGDILPTPRQVECIEKKEFAAAALDLEHEVFVVHIAAFRVDPGDKMHPSKRAQIAHLKADEALIEVLSEYANFADVFSLKLVAEFLEYGINNHAIELVDN